MCRHRFCDNGCEVQFDGRILVAAGGGGKEHPVSHRLDTHRQDIAGAVLRPFCFGAGGGDREVEVGIAVGRRSDGQACELTAGQGPGAVAVVNSGGEACAIGDTADGDGEAFRAVGVGQSRGDIEGDGPIFCAGGTVDAQLRRVGHRVDRNRQ